MVSAVSNWAAMPSPDWRLHATEIKRRRGPTKRTKHQDSGELKQRLVKDIERAFRSLVRTEQTYAPDSCGIRCIRPIGSCPRQAV